MPPVVASRAVATARKLSLGLVATSSATTGDLPGATSVVFSSRQGEGGHLGGQAVSSQDSRVGRFGRGIVVVMKTSTSSLAVLALALVQVS